MSQRILVVDDEPAIADVVADQLRSDDYDVAVVHDGLAAVAYCGATPLDLMVLDPMLPGLDGVGQMLRQTERLGRMVSQLLDLSRLESGADPFERTSVQVSALPATLSASSISPRRTRS